MTQEIDPKEMSLVDHLDELRNTLIRIVIAMFIASAVGFGFSEYLLNLLLMQAKGVDFVVIAPTEGFFTLLKVGILGGVILIFPYLIYQIWHFVEPGLTNDEASFVYKTTPFMVLLFLSGITLAYLFVIPLGLEFLLKFQVAQVKATLSIEKYVSFCFTLLMVFGILMELPVFLLILHSVGLVNSQLLSKYRSHTMVSFFILSALLTPPDIVTQVLVALPMVFLFEISLFIMRLRERRGLESNAKEDSTIS